MSGIGFTGRKHSEASKLLISQRGMGKIASPETRDKLRRANTGKIRSEEARRNMSLARKGKKLSKEHKAKIGLSLVGNTRNTPDSIAKLRILMKGNKYGVRPQTESEKLHHRNATIRHLETVLPEDCACTAHHPIWQGTKLELRLRKLLEDFPAIEPNKHFGMYEVDVYIPSHHLAFEADGGYWHQNKERDSKRDAKLLERFGLIVVRLNDLDLKQVII